MCFIDRDKRDALLSRKCKHCIRQQPLRRYVDDFIATFRCKLQGLSNLIFCEGAVDISCVDTGGVQHLDLITHEGNERGNDDRDTRKHECRYLIAEGFAAACREDA